MTSIKFLKDHGNMEIAETNRKAISCPCNQNRFNRILNTAAHSSEDSFLGTFPI